MTCFQGLQSQSKTFLQFDADVQAAAGAIDGDGEPNSILVTVAGNSYLHLVYLTAAVLSGRIICPINPHEGKTRIKKKIASLASPSSVWTDDENLIPHLKGLRLMTLSRAGTMRRNFPKNGPFALIFTSGSSGESKIVEWSEQNLLANIDALIEHHRMDAGLQIGTPLPVYHVNALGFSFFASLLAGSELVLFDRFNPASLQYALRGRLVNVLSLVPTHLNLLLNRARGFSKEDWKGVKYVVSAAAPLSCDLVRAFVDRFHVRIIQGYGLSEAVNFSTTLPIDLTDDEYVQVMMQTPHPSVGVALNGNEVEVLDSAGNPMPSETPGEIALHGANLMRGYRGVAPEETFMNGRFYTGDIGYFRDIGAKRYFFIAGRKRDVIKRYGETISLREVDDLFRNFNADADCIAVGFANEVAGEELGLAIQDLQPDLKARLEGYMKSNVPPMFRPRVVFATPKNLRTPSGKPQRWRFQEEFVEFQIENISSKLIVKRDKEQK